MPAKREYTPSTPTSTSNSSDNNNIEEEDDDIKPSLKKLKSPSPSKKSSPTKSKSESTSTSPIKTKVKAGTEDSTSPKKIGAWSGDELKLLYSIMCPKRTGVNWSDVSSQIPGRDAKSCNNKWSRIQGKIMKAIEELGE